MILNSKLGSLTLIAVALALAGCDGETETTPDASRRIESAGRSIPWEEFGSLAELAQYGLLEAINKRIAEGADINAPYKPFGFTPLQAATRAGQAAVVERLLALGADPNTVSTENPEAPLCLAAFGGSPGHTESVRLLLSNGARPNDKCLLPMGWGKTALIRAAEVGNAEAVRLLLAAGADVNAVDWHPHEVPRRDKTALMYAASEGHAEVVKLLVEGGAAVNAKMLPYGWTALWLAADTGGGVRPEEEADYAAIARELLEHGADVSAAPSSDPRTPLLVAAQVNSAKLVSVLLEFGADLNDRDPEGETALMHAAKRGDVAMVLVLLRNGADRMVTDKHGRTAQQLAAMLGFSEAAHALDTAPALEGGVKAGKSHEVSQKAETEQPLRSAAWQFEVPDGISRGPYLAADVVLVQDWNYLIHELDAASGTEMLTLQATGVITAPPVMHGGVLYVGESKGVDEAGQGSTYALKPHTGEKVWRRTFRGTIQYLLPAGEGLFMQTRDGELHAIDPPSGNSRWQADIGPGSLLRPAIVGDVIVVVTGAGNLQGIDAKTGQPMWQLAVSKPDPGALRFNQTVLDTLTTDKSRDHVQSRPPDELYFYGTGFCDALAQGIPGAQLEEDMATFLGSDVARALARAARAEICPPGTSPEQIQRIKAEAYDAARGARKVATGPVATDSGLIFVQLGETEPDRTVVGLDARSGAIIFSQPLSGFGTKPPVTDGKSVFLQDGQNLVAFDIPSKTRRWMLDLQSLAQSGYEPTKILQDDHLILDGGTLLGVDVATGIAAWRSAPALQHPMLVGAANGVVYCRTDANYYGIDATNGTMLWAASTRRGEFADQAPLDVAHSQEMFFFSAGRYVFAVSTKDGDSRAP